MSKQVEKIKELVAKREQARLGGGEKAIEKQHARGKYTARERIEMLVDEGSFEEYDMFKKHRCTNFGMEKKHFYGDGVVAGSATVDGRLVYVYAQDFTVNGGSLSETMAQKICKVMDMAMTMGAPVICMNDSGGARIQEGICALAGYGEIFERNILASGVIPQISAIMGPCAGGAVYSPALTDFIIMKEQTSYMFLTGPKVVKTVTGEDIDAEHLGGASVHATKSGVTHFAAKTEEEAIEMIKSLLSFIPSNNTEEAPSVECDDPINRMEDSLNEIIPDDPNKAYDMYKVIGAITDNGEFFEIQPKFAKNIIIGFARFNGRSVGIVANQPAAYAGVLDVNASRKAARFVRFCDAFNIPIVSLVDVPDSSPVQVRNTTPLSSTEHSSFTLTARQQCPRSPLLCARVMAVATSLWAASSFVPTSTSHGLLQRLPLWEPAEPLPSFAARKPRQRRKQARTLRHSLQRRKRNTQRSLPTRTRQPLTDISTTLSSRATHASASVVHLLSLQQSASRFRQRSTDVCRCNLTFDS